MWRIIDGPSFASCASVSANVKLQGQTLIEFRVWTPNLERPYKATLRVDSSDHFSDEKWGKWSFTGTLLGKDNEEEIAVIGDYDTRSGLGLIAKRTPQSNPIAPIIAGSNSV